MTDRKLGEYLKHHSWIAGRSFWYVLFRIPWYFWQTYHVTRPNTEGRWLALRFACIYSAWFLHLAREK